MWSCPSTSWSPTTVHCFWKKNAHSSLWLTLRSHVPCWPCSISSLSVPCLRLDSFSVEIRSGLFHRYSVLCLGSLLPTSSSYLSLVSQLIHYLSREALLFPSWLCTCPWCFSKHPAFFLSEPLLEHSNTLVAASPTVPWAVCEVGDSVLITILSSGTAESNILYMTGSK